MMAARPWRKVRAAILAEADYRCARCGAPTEDVDHALPVAEGGSRDPANIRALCPTCHGTGTTSCTTTHNTKGTT